MILATFEMRLYFSAVNHGKIVCGYVLSAKMPAVSWHHRRIRKVESPNMRVGRLLVSVFNFALSPMCTPFSDLETPDSSAHKPSPWILTTVSRPPITGGPPSCMRFNEGLRLAFSVTPPPGMLPRLRQRDCNVSTAVPFLSQPPGVWMPIVFYVEKT